MATSTITTTTLPVSTKTEAKTLADESLEGVAQALWEVNHQVSIHHTKKTKRAKSEIYD